MPKPIELTPKSKRILNKLSKAGKVDLRPTFKVIGDSYRREVKQIFEKQQPRATGMRWEKLSRKYKEWKERNYPGRPILVLTGRLKESMISRSSGNITDIRNDSASFGTSVPYAKYHQEGTRKMPKRDFATPSDRRLNIFKDNINDGIVYNFERNGIRVSSRTVL